MNEYSRCWKMCNANGVRGRGKRDTQRIFEPLPIFCTACIMRKENEFFFYAVKVFNLLLRRVFVPCFSAGSDFARKIKFLEDQKLSCHGILGDLSFYANVLKLR